MRCFWVVLTLAAMSAGGCGGCGCSDSWRVPEGAGIRRSDDEEEQEQRSAERIAKRNARMAELRRRKKEEAEQQRAKRRPTRQRDLPEAPLPMELQPKELPPPPEQFARWKAEDYLNARLLGDARLPEAVTFLGEHFADDPRTVELLSRLLLPPTPQELAEVELPEGYRDRRPGGRSGSARLNRRVRNRSRTTAVQKAVVAAIGMNRTSEAQQVLRQILAGTLAEDIDRAVAEAAVQALVDNPSPANDAMLMRLITEPEEVRPPGRGSVTAAELRATALEMIQENASASLRVKLAEYISDPTTVVEPGDALADFLEAQTPENVPAQVVLYQSVDTPEPVKQAFEGHFTEYGGAALRRALGLPVGESTRRLTGGYRPTPEWMTVARRSSRDTCELDAAACCRLGSVLWSEPLVSVVCRRMEQVPSLAEPRRCVALAATMPVDAVRGTLHKVLQAHWENGPSSFESAGMPEKRLCDPALLILAKTLPRSVPEEQRMASRPGVMGGRRGASGRGGYRDSSLFAVRERAAREAYQKRRQAEEAWMALSYQLLVSWCDRLDEAAVAREKAARKAGRKPPNDTSPVDPVKLPPELTLHDETRVVDAYDVDWPEAAPKALGSSALGLLRVRYLRIEETTRPNRLVGYYRRQLSSPDSYHVDGGMWLDSLSDTADGENKLSVDVRIVRADDRPDEPYREDEELPMRVEILSVEMRKTAGMR